MTIKNEICTIGIDMGGTKVAAAPFENKKLILDEMLKEPTPQTGSDDILALMTKMVKEIQEKRKIDAIGISTAGMVNDKGEMIGGCGNIKGWKGAKVKKELEALTGLPVVVENDANCAAFAEYSVGCAEEFNPVLLVIVGTGIGGGLVWDNRIWRGANFGGGELGHIKISCDHARKCTCGAWDCWESYASGTGLQTTARLYFADPEIDNYKLMEKFKNGDVTAIDTISAWHEYLAVGMSSVINALDPEAVVVSGGMAQFINYPKLNKKVRDKVVDGLKDHIRILEGVLGNDSGMIGAACLANLAVSGELAASLNTGHQTEFV